MLLDDPSANLQGETIVLPNEDLRPRSFVFISRSDKATECPPASIETPGARRSDFLVKAVMRDGSRTRDRQIRNLML